MSQAKDFSRTARSDVNNDVCVASESAYMEVVTVSTVYYPRTLAPCIYVRWEAWYAISCE